MGFALSFYSLLDLKLTDIISAIQRRAGAGIQYAVVGQSAVRDCFVGLCQIANPTTSRPSRPCLHSCDGT